MIPGKMVDNDFHDLHYGGDATPAVRCRVCKATGELRLVDGEFLCRDAGRCARVVAKRQRGLRRIAGLTGGRG